MANYGGVTENGWMWYKLDDKARTARLSYEKPTRGDWESRNRVIKSKYILIEGQETDTTAMQIFSCTTRGSNDYILKPIMVTWNEKKNAWIVFYPEYVEFEPWWETNWKAGRKVSMKDAFCLKFVKRARKILKFLIKAHDEGVRHGQLSAKSNYVIVKEGSVEKLMIINLGIRRDQESDEVWRVSCADDLKDVLTLLQTLISQYRPVDLILVINFLTYNAQESQKILSFPYWRKAYKRMKVFLDADKVVKSDNSLITPIIDEVERRGDFNLPWDTKLRSPPSSTDLEVVRGLKGIYWNKGVPSYNGTRFEALIEFLRDVFAHATNGGIYSVYDDYINKFYPGFISIVHMVT